MLTMFIELDIRHIVRTANSKYVRYVIYDKNRKF